MPLSDLQYEDVAWLNGMKVAVALGKSPRDRARLTEWNTRIDRVLITLAEAASIIMTHDNADCVPQPYKEPR